MKNLINKSSVSTEFLKLLVKFSCKNISPYPTIVFKDSNSESSAIFYPNRGNPIIIVRIFKSESFPFYLRLSDIKIKKTGYVGEYFFKTLDQTIIYYLNHELKHYLQYLNPKTRHWIYKNSKKSETDADLYAFKKLKQWLKK